MVLGGNRVSSKKIQDAGFKFKYPELEEAMREVYGK
jgi:NAD dependent epimerase/dehydratase family enzyme